MAYKPIVLATDGSAFAAIIPRFALVATAVTS